MSRPFGELGGGQAFTASQAAKVQGAQGPHLVIEMKDQAQLITQMAMDLMALLLEYKAQIQGEPPNDSVPCEAPGGPRKEYVGGIYSDIIVAHIQAQSALDSALAIARTLSA